MTIALQEALNDLLLMLAVKDKLSLFNFQLNELGVSGLPLKKPNLVFESSNLTLELAILILELCQELIVDFENAGLLLKSIF